MSSSYDRFSASSYEYDKPKPLYSEYKQQDYDKYKCYRDQKMYTVNKTIFLKPNKVNFKFNNPYAPPKEDFGNEFSRRYSQDKLHSKLSFHNLDHPI